MVFLKSVVYVRDQVFPCNCCGFCFQQLLFSPVSHLEPRSETSFFPRQGSAGKRRVSTCCLSPTAKPTRTARVRVRATGWKGKPKGRWVGSMNLWALTGPQRLSVSPACVLIVSAQFHPTIGTKVPNATSARSSLSLRAGSLILGRENGSNQNFDRLTKKRGLTLSPPNLFD